MATLFRFVVPGNANPFTFGIVPYARRPTKLVGDQTVDRPIGEDLFDYLYPYPILANSAAEKQQMAAESQFEKLPGGFRSILFKNDVVNDAERTRVASPEYNNRLAFYNQDYFRNTVTVYQRFWAATRADSDKPLIATMGIVLCVFVVIYDPVNRIAAAAHLDKNQNSEEIATIIPNVFSSNGALDIYIIGGQPSDRGMEEATRRNIQGQLKSFFEHSENATRQMTVRMCEVIGRLHPNEMTFDTRNGCMIPVYNGAPPIPKVLSAKVEPPKVTVMGQPLDSVCRYWPNGQYWVDPDSSGLAVEANKLRTADPPNNALADRLTIMRCQWDGTVGGWPTFYAEMNELICGLNIVLVFEFVRVDPTVLDNVHLELTTRLKQFNKPMMLEQSLKSWIKWRDAIERLGLEKAAGLAEGLTMKRGEMSLTSQIIRVLKSMEGAPTRSQILERLDVLLPAWIEKKDFAVDWEGRH